jgi:hypothetical protein
MLRKTTNNVAYLLKARIVKPADRPDLPSEGAPDIDKTVNVQKLISGHEPHMGLDTKTD